MNLVNHFLNRKNPVEDTSSQSNGQLGNRSVNVEKNEGRVSLHWKRMILEKDSPYVYVGVKFDLEMDEIE